MVDQKQSPGLLGCRCEHLLRRAPPATSVANRRSAACSSASPGNSVVLTAAPDHLSNRTAQSPPFDAARRSQRPVPLSARDDNDIDEIDDAPRRLPRPDGDHDP